MNIDQKLDRAGEKLHRNGFYVYGADGVDSAVKRILEIIKPNETVGIGGSVTLQQIDLLQKLEARGQKLIVHQPGMPKDESLAVRRKALAADVYVASPNAVTLTGALLFMDGVGNRASGMIFGPAKVIAVAGQNKVVMDEAEGWKRIREIAAPKNAKRLNLQAPCVITGMCTDCAVHERICNIGVTLWKRPKYTEYHVILVPADLGY